MPTILVRVLAKMGRGEQSPLLSKEGTCSHFPHMLNPMAEVSTSIICLVSVLSRVTSVTLLHLKLILELKASTVSPSKYAVVKIQIGCDCIPTTHSCTSQGPEVAGTTSEFGQNLFLGLISEKDGQPSQAMKVFFWPKGSPPRKKLSRTFTF